jgi:hypothetical protein
MIILQNETSGKKQRSHYKQFYDSESESGTSSFSPVNETRKPRLIRVDLYIFWETEVLSSILSKQVIWHFSWTLKTWQRASVSCKLPVVMNLRRLSFCLYLARVRGLQFRGQLMNLTHWANLNWKPAHELELLTNTFHQPQRRYYTKIYYTTIT